MGKKTKNRNNRHNTNYKNNNKVKQQCNTSKKKITKSNITNKSGKFKMFKKKAQQDDYYISIIDATPVTAEETYNKRKNKAKYKAEHTKELPKPECKSFNIYNIIFIVAILVAIVAALYIVYTVICDIRESQLSSDLSGLHNSVTTAAESNDDLEDDVYNEDYINSILSGQDDTLRTSEDSLISDDSSALVSETSEISDTQQEEIVRDKLLISSEMGPFYAQNSDTVGWLTLGGTKIDNVVVQTTDNDYYLNHNFKKEVSQPGTLFVDYRCNISDYNDLQSSNIIIYGHKQKSGSMFGTLNYYHNNLDFYKEHPTFTFSNLYETYTYKIVAMFTCKTLESVGATEDNVFDYQNYINFKDSGKYTFSSFITNIKQRSEINTPVSITPNDNYMILSTCSYEYLGARFVVVARRVKDGESVDVAVEKATVNNYKITD